MMRKIMAFIVLMSIITCGAESICAFDESVINDIGAERIIDSQNVLEVISGNQQKAADQRGFSVNNEANEVVEDGSHLEDASISENNFEMNEDTENGANEEISEISLNDIEEKVQVDERAEIFSGSENKIQEDEKSITKISIPTNVKIYLNPENIGEKGEVFSENYEIVNYGVNDVAIKIKNISAMFRQKRNSYEFFESGKEKTVEEMISNTEKVNIDMIWENDSGEFRKNLKIVNGKTDESVLYLKATEGNKNVELQSLDNNSKGKFYFSGTLGDDPNIQWENIALLVEFEYEIIQMNKVDNIADFERNFAIEINERENRVNAEAELTIDDGENKKHELDYIKEGNEENEVKMKE